MAEKSGPIVYCSAKGRMGDILFTYIKAKWFSTIHHLPLYLEPYEIYQKLCISDQEKFLDRSSLTVSPICVKDIFEKKGIQHENTIFTIQTTPTLIHLGYEHKLLSDHSFREEIRNLIQLKDPIDLIYPPVDKISVAVHIRKGSKKDKPLLSQQIFDTKGMRNLSIPVDLLKRGIYKYSVYQFLIADKIDRYSDVKYTGKFIPEQFFIDALKKLSCLLEHQPIYVHIFTDDAHPKKLTKKIEDHVGLENMTFAYSDKNFFDPNSALYDFFSIKNFDCLIRPFSSHFSIVAEVIGNHKIVMAPKKLHWKIDEQGLYYLVVDDIVIKKQPTF